MDNLFNIPSRRFGKIAEARLVVKGYPEFDESQARAADGTWGGGGGGGGGSKPAGSGGGWKKLVAAAGGVAALAATLAAAGVPVLRGAAGLRHARRAVLAARAGAARTAMRNVPRGMPSGTRATSFHTRSEADIIRNERAARVFALGGAGTRSAANLARDRTATGLRSIDRMFGGKPRYPHLQQASRFMRR